MISWHVDMYTGFLFIKKPLSGKGIYANDEILVLLKKLLGQNGIFNAI